MQPPHHCSCCLLETQRCPCGTALPARTWRRCGGGCGIPGLPSPMAPALSTQGFMAFSPCCSVLWEGRNPRVLFRILSLFLLLASYPNRTPMPSYHIFIMKKMVNVLHKSTGASDGEQIRVTYSAHCILWNLWK